MNIWQKMSLCIGLITTLISMAAPTYAETQRQRFGNITCQTHVPCEDDSEVMSAADYAADATQCLTQGLGLSAPDGYFDESAGVDRDGCLSINPHLLSSKGGKSILPLCCVSKRPDGKCSFFCSLVDGW